MQLPAGSAKMRSGAKARSRPAASSRSAKGQPKQPPAASAGDLGGRHAARGGEARVHETGVLVVEDDCDASAAVVKQSGGAQDQGRLPRSEIAADQGQRRHTSMIRSLPRVIATSSRKVTT